MKLLLIITILILSSCTQKEFANTWVHCPCIVEVINKEEDEYYITARSIEDHAEYFSFYTTSIHSIGDTIK